MSNGMLVDSTAAQRALRFMKRNNLCGLVESWAIMLEQGTRSHE